MKFYIKIIAFLIINSQFVINNYAQTNLIISGGNWVNQNSNIVLKDTKFTNNSTFHAGSGMVIVTGDATTAQSELGGTSQTTFHNLRINKNTNDASLGQHTTVNNLLLLTGGKLEINNYNLTMANSASFSNISKDRYIKTNGTGFLIRQVGTTWTSFPVGKLTFNPARLKNDGTLDNFRVRVEDHFLQNGTAGASITTNVIPKTWLIEEATIGGSNVSMQLVWRPIHVGSGFNTNASHITHFTGGNWQDQTSGVSTADNSYSSDHRYREATNITSFSPFGVKSGASLPVELLYFYAEKEGQNVRLDWQTATELNNSHFDVEWSRDGISFEKIGEVAGAGTTTEVQFYDFLHTRPINGENYYRLRQFDLPTGQAGFDGKFELTQTINITFEQSNHSIIRIYPNPAAHYLKIESQDLIGKIVQVFNVNGQLVRAFQHQSLITNLPITELPSGTYFIKIGKQVKKVIISK